MTTSWDDVRPYFERDAVAHVATLMPDGAPHSVPVWIGVEGDRLAFFSVAGSRKDENVQADPRVAFSITTPDNPLDMAFVRGEVVERITGDAAFEIIDPISQKYAGKPYFDRSAHTAFLVRPDTSWFHDYSAD
ncbi:MAG: pyridoxamine 5'-phosphate oxidase family protein [Microbacterium sp.]